jgi:hypothetical protein
MSEVVQALSKFVVMCSLGIMAGVAVYWGGSAFVDFYLPIWLVAVGVGLMSAALLALVGDLPRTRAALNMLGLMIAGGIIAVMLHGFVATSDLDQGRLGGVAIDVASLGRTVLMVYALVALLLAPAGVIVWKALDVVERATKSNPAAS